MYEVLNASYIKINDSFNQLSKGGKLSREMKIFESMGVKSRFIVREVLPEAKLDTYARKI